MRFRVIDVPVQIDLEVSDEDADLISGNFSMLPRLAEGVAAEIHLGVSQLGAAYSIQWADSQADPIIASREELIHGIEAELVPALQLRRPHLFFLHSAVLRRGDSAFLITGASGQGKSTLCWALTHFGCTYMSDELAPLQLTHRGPVAQSYSHSLNMKNSPPPPFSLPGSTPFTGWTYHIPVESLQGGFSLDPCPVNAVFFVSRGEQEPSVNPMTEADAAFRIFPNVLNALAHEKSGLSAAAQLTATVSSFAVNSADLKQTCALVIDAIGCANAA